MLTQVDVQVHPDEAAEVAWPRVAARALGVEINRIGGVFVLRRSIDARKGRVRVNLRLQVAVDETLDDVPKWSVADLPPLSGPPRVAVIGAGPAGLWAAWTLAQRGIKAVLLDRGSSVRGRRPHLARLNREGVLNPESNYCFGEGGAGTYSDGKLYTRATKRGPVRDIIELMADCGAPPRILVDARPHIGTNRLPRVIAALTGRLEAAGVQVCFDTRVDDLRFDGRRLTGIALSDGTVIPVEAAIVATGHSARDVYRLLHRHQVAMSAKAFAAGVRIEHPQAHIDRIQYGDLAGHPELGAAPYTLKRTARDIGVYSFCMCPGGFIVAAATETDGVVVNGMSPYARGSRFANSGMVVSLEPSDFPGGGEHPLSGLELQASLEQAAFQAGGGRFAAPAQRVDDFLAGRISTDLPTCSYRPGLVASDLTEVLPARIHTPLAEALRWFERARMRGYVTREAVMVGVESRSSSPVRIERVAETGMSPSHEGVFPCGEGAGFAGGIVSAALDGVRSAQWALRHLGEG